MFLRIFHLLIWYLALLLVLDEKYEDVLVNVNIMDTEHTKKNFQNVKDQAGYRAYDQEVVDELTGWSQIRDPCL